MRRRSFVKDVAEMARRGLLCRTLVSQDAGWYEPGKPNGGTHRPHVFPFDTFVPALRKRGFADAEIRQLLADNPSRAFALALRRTQTLRGTRG